jgi:hypothetical protein
MIADPVESILIEPVLSSLRRSVSVAIMKYRKATRVRMFAPSRIEAENNDQAGSNTELDV